MVFKCPFCGLDASADAGLHPHVTHSKPMCKEFDDAEDALAYMRAVNEKLFGKERVDELRKRDVS